MPEILSVSAYRQGENMTLFELVFKIEYLILVNTIIMNLFKEIFGNQFCIFCLNNTHVHQEKMNQADFFFRNVKR